MLHIKDIEAFAHINEALAEREESQRNAVSTGESTADGHHPALHPALLLALAARAQAIPYREDDGPAEDAGQSSPPAEPPTSLAAVIARLLFPR